MSAPRLAVVVLISGRGSNLQALIDAAAGGRLQADLRAVVSNEANAAGLARAAAAGIDTRVVDHRAFDGRDAFDAALARCIDTFAPDLVVLAGFMRVLTAGFVQRYRGRLINIHPSLLPDFPGLDTHRRALQAGVAEHGASVHFVTPQLDGGPVIARARVPVRREDEPDALAARVLAQEHRLLPEVVQWFARGRVTLDAHDEVLLDGQPLAAPVDV